ncbi:hypothetical protein QBC40DRAFT_278848 [Triangularia verruculosa]|uniref:Secreted protein n=1 Tax=Triangularia verruculosa TaxID=2587418 RepID=A0AAN6XIW0_9PEZI|nr:hypothetical protein QBC40DRAFT_278848 [Triangularia verruculosa]
MCLFVYLERKHFLLCLLLGLILCGKAVCGRVMGSVELFTYCLLFCYMRCLEFRGEMCALFWDVLCLGREGGVCYGGK